MLDTVVKNAQKIVACHLPKKGLAQAKISTLVGCYAQDNQEDSEVSGIYVSGVGPGGK
jgi:hypothetical protein